jgi:hypothetical protein
MLRMTLFEVELSKVPFWPGVGATIIEMMRS